MTAVPFPGQLVARADSGPMIVVGPASRPPAHEPTEACVAVQWIGGDALPRRMLCAAEVLRPWDGPTGWPEILARYQRAAQS